MLKGFRTLDIRKFGLDPDKEEDRKKGYKLLEEMEKLSQK